MKRTRLRRIGKSETALQKQEIQRLVREICMVRDKGCILRDKRHCGGILGTVGVVFQADHLVTRANPATFADTRLIVCVCKGCHAWKHWHKDEYDELVKTVLSKETVELWDRCEEDRRSHKTYKPDWKLAILVLNQELKEYEKTN